MQGREGKGLFYVVLIKSWPGVKNVCRELQTEVKPYIKFTL